MKGSTRSHMGTDGITSQVKEKKKKQNLGAGMVYM